ncbi:hypothetical protein [Actinorugispora endophytica]|uniref:Uncharacterized protein n=1 Tax=Actinorugispora endophytica TaxID=1605990 RepID=A0A4R6V627_9ACTN|nr:hypothetical protein [Actinorugispora endophytica]TDQ54338.1 hypothetical protein EV190_102172 [Actinorugispora endophytica]
MSRLTRIACAVAATVVPGAVAGAALGLGGGVFTREGWEAASWVAAVAALLLVCAPVWVWALRGTGEPADPRPLPGETTVNTIGGGVSGTALQGRDFSGPVTFHSPAPSERPVPDGEAAPGRERARRSEPDVEVFALTTPAARIGRRIARLLPWIGGLASAAAFPGFYGVVSAYERGALSAGDWTAALTHGYGVPGTIPGVAAVMAAAALAGLVMSLRSEGADGRDLLVVDPHNLTVMDRRWLRWPDRSFSVLWGELERVRVAADPDGAAHAVVVDFEDDRAPDFDWRDRHGVDLWHDGGLVVARLPMPSRGAAPSARLRTALARFAGGVYTRD